MNEVESLCDRIAILRQGEMAFIRHSRRINTAVWEILLY